MDYQQQFQTPDRTGTLVNTALVVGLVGIFLCPIPVFGLILPSLAMMFALLSRGRSMQTQSKAKAGLVLGIIGLIISVVVTVALVTYTFSQITVEEWQQFYEFQEETDFQEPFDL